MLGKDSREWMLFRLAGAAVAEPPLVCPRDDSSPLLDPDLSPPPRRSCCCLEEREAGRGGGMPGGAPSALGAPPSMAARLGLALRVSGVVLPQSRGEDWEDLMVRDTVTGLQGYREQDIAPWLANCERMRGKYRGSA